MSNDWMNEEPIEDGDESGGGAAQERSSGGGKAKLALAALLAVGGLAYFKGNTLVGRYWPSSPQRAEATIALAAPAAQAKPAPARPKSKPAAQTQPVSEPAANTVTSIVPLPDAPEEPEPVPAPVAPKPEPHPPVPPPPADPATRPAAPTVAAVPATQPASRFSLAGLFGAFAAKTRELPKQAEPIEQVRQSQPATDAEARQSSLLSSLQTLRSQIELYKLQHQDKAPDFKRYAAWAQLLKATHADGTVDATGALGPYLSGVPVNPLNGSATVGLSQRDPTPGEPLRTTNTIGWVYCVTTERLYATNADGKTVFDDGAAFAARGRGGPTETTVNILPESDD